MEQTLAHCNTISQGNSLFPKKKGQAGKGHDAQAAHLNKQQDHCLPGSGEFLTGINHDQAGNTDRRGRGEQGIQPGDDRSSAAERAVQKSCSEKNRSQKEKDREGYRGEKASDFIAKANIHSGVEVQRIYFFRRSLRGDYKEYSPYLQ
jgi:hypothetical protein